MTERNNKGALAAATLELDMLWLKKNAPDLKVSPEKFSDYVDRFYNDGSSVRVYSDGLNIDEVRLKAVAQLKSEQS